MKAKTKETKTAELKVEETQTNLSCIYYAVCKECDFTGPEHDTKKAALADATSHKNATGHSASYASTNS
jgi:hypothetical protein